MKKTKRKVGLVMGQYGIEGNTGLTGATNGIFHISANYDSNGKVFVDDDMGWKRVTPLQAKKRKLHVITCAMCKKPAVSVDHHHPYMSDNNRCKKHWGKT